MKQQFVGKRFLRDSENPQIEIGKTITPYFYPNVNKTKNTRIMRLAGSI